MTYHSDMNIFEKLREKCEKCENPQMAIIYYFLIKNSEKSTSQISQATSHKTRFSHFSLTSRPHATFFAWLFLDFSPKTIQL